MPLDAHEVEEIVRGPLVDQLASVNIVSLSVREDVDHDGDPILRIRVTFKDDGKRLQASKVKGLIRHLRTALAGENEERFPVLSFQVENEPDGEPSEAA